MTNIYDAVCLAILIFFMASGFSKGLVRSAFGIVSTIVTMILTWAFFPYAVRFLRAFGAYGNIQQAFAQSINLQGAADGAAHALQTEFINSLPQSPFILGHIQANNNPEAYSVLDVSNLSGYISGYFANMAVNLIAVIGLFIIIRILLSLVLNVMDLLAKLPIVNIFNRIGGAAFGLAAGLIFIWVVLCVMTFFFLNENNADLFNKIETGVLTGFLYDYNPIMKVIVTLVP